MSSLQIINNTKAAGNFLFRAAKTLIPNSRRDLLFSGTVTLLSLTAGGGVPGAIAAFAISRLPQKALYKAGLITVLFLLTVKNLSHQEMGVSAPFSNNPPEFFSNALCLNSKDESPPFENSFFRSKEEEETWNLYSSETLQADDDFMINSALRMFASHNYNGAMCKWVQTYSHKLDKDTKDWILDCLAENGDFEAVSFLIDQKIHGTQASHFSSAISQTVRNQEDPLGQRRSLLKDLIPRGLPEDHDSALTTAAYANQPWAIEILLKCGKISLNGYTKAFLKASENGHLTIAQSLALTGNIDLKTALAALSLASDHPAVTQMLYRRFPSLRKTQQTSLRIASEARDEASVRFLLKAGANPYKSVPIVKFLIQIGYFPSAPKEEWLLRLDSAQKSKVLAAYADRLPLTGNFFDMIQKHIQDLSSSDQFALLQICLIQALESSAEQWILSYVPSFSSDEQFRLNSAALLRNLKCADSLKAVSHLTETQEISLERLRMQILEKTAQENGQIQEILLAEKTRQTQLHPRPKQEDWESSVKNRIEPHLVRIRNFILNFSTNKILPDIKYYNSGDIVVEFVKEFPGIIFKTLPPDKCSDDPGAERYARNRYETSLKMQEKGNHFARLRFPRSYLGNVQDTQGNSLWFVAEEKLQIQGGDCLSFLNLVKTMNRNSETKKILDDSITQLVHFAYDAKLIDIKPQNAPFLADGTGFALLDTDELSGRDGLAGLYHYDNWKNLASNVDESSLDTMQNALKTIDPKRFDNTFDFAALEARHRERIATQTRQEKIHAKNGIIGPNDPIRADKSVFEGLSDLDRAVATEMIGVLNRKIANDQFALRFRVVFYKGLMDSASYGHLRKMIPDIDADNMSFSKIIENAEIRVLRHLLAHDLIFGVEDAYGEADLQLYRGIRITC
ncbi:MAG: hypothetical protein V4487_06810 [Chlamydiota bacterium]